MTTPEQIQDQINREDIIPYLNGVCEAHLTDEFIEQFRIAMMLLPVTSHQYRMDDIETMSKRRPDEITRRECGMMLNAIFAVPWGNMYITLEEGIEKTRVFEKIRDEYAKNSQAFERKVEKKRSRLMQLGGVGNSVPLNGNGNGLKIIPK